MLDYSEVTLVDICKTANAELKRKIPSDKKMKKKGYRPSYLAGVNPRSKTYVREGTVLQRVGGPLAGSAVGSLAGRAIDVAAKGRTAGLGMTAGSALGGTAGFYRNIKSGDTASYERSTGKKADGKVQLPFSGLVLNDYPRDKEK